MAFDKIFGRFMTEMTCYVRAHLGGPMQLFVSRMQNFCIIYDYRCDSCYRTLLTISDLIFRNA